MRTESRAHMRPRRRFSSLSPLLPALALTFLAVAVLSVKTLSNRATSLGGGVPVGRRAVGKGYVATGVLAGFQLASVCGGRPAGALELKLPKVPSISQSKPEQQPQATSTGPQSLVSADGTWELKIPDGFQLGDDNLVNKVTGKHIEQYQYLSTKRPKFSILVSEDPMPNGFKIPSLEDVAERTLEIQKGKAYVDQVELLDFDAKDKNGVEIRDIRYMVTTARDEDRYFSLSAAENKRIYSLQVRVRNRDYEKFAPMIDEVLQSFKVKKVVS